MYTFIYRVPICTGYNYMYTFIYRVSMLKVLTNLQPCELNHVHLPSPAHWKYIFPLNPHVRLLVDC